MLKQFIMLMGNLAQAASQEWFRTYKAIRTLQRYFLNVLITCALICVSIEVIFSGPQIRIPPPYTLSHRYLLSDITDERRTGNQLFNFASLIGIAKRHNMTPVMPADFNLRNIFDFNITARDRHTIGMHLSHSEYGRRACAYDVGTERLEFPFKYRLLGYYQSWMYFRDAETEVRQHLHFKPEIQIAADKYLREHIPLSLQNPHVVKVGVHIRRGDQTKPHFVWYGYTSADPDYFKRAMSHFVDKYGKVIFIVCSDDMEWSEENIDRDTYSVIFSHSGSAETDLAMLASCDHTVMSVGSFSWWAAWLAGGDTVYYKHWPKPYSRLEYDVNKQQYFPPHWIPL